MSSNVTIVNSILGGTVSPTDRGLAYGDGVFRTLKVQNGKPKLWMQHYQKLKSDCAAISIVCPAENVLLDDLQALLNSNSNKDFVIKIIITRGDGERGYAPPINPSPLRILSLAPLPQYALNESVVLRVCETRLGAQPKLAGIKHLNRLENVIARAEWQDIAIFDGILCDTQNNVIECTAANIFARFGNVVQTPNLMQCGVAGITRDLILRTMHKFGFSTEITDIPLAKLLLADEAVICNSLYGALQVKEIGTTIIGNEGLAVNIRKALEEID